MSRVQGVLVVVILAVLAAAAISTQVSPAEARWLLRLPVVRGAIAGALVALKVDFDAFRSFQTIDDAAQYRWSTALLHLVQGAMNGAGVAAGISELGGV